MEAGGFEGDKVSQHTVTSDNKPQQNTTKSGVEGEVVQHFATPENNQNALEIARTLRADADLAGIVEAWPNLPEHIRAAIKTLVQTNTKQKE
jgi:hypothetical protein